MLSYLIVGSGYRSEYYARITKKYPDLFHAMVLCRTLEKASQIQARTGVTATADLKTALSFNPSFVVVAVDKDHIADVTEEWAMRGFAVVAETPIADSIEKMNRLWKLSHSAKIVCAEQYHRYPLLATGIRHLPLIGRPTSAYISLAHDYHGFSLIREVLQTRGEGYRVSVHKAASEVIATDSRYGAILDGQSITEERVTAFIEFASGKRAVYDFSPVQYRSFIRSRHLTVRGDRGEWNDRVILYLDEDNKPLRYYLLPEVDDPRLDTQILRDGRKTWTPELFLDTEQDEYAVASLLLGMGDYLKDGSSPYSISDALDDAYFGILLKQAAQSPGQSITAQAMAWSNYC